MLKPAIQLIAALLCASTTRAGDAPWAPAKAPGAVRVATFNVWDFRDDPADALRAARLAGVIRSLAPDVLLLNEVVVTGEGSEVATSASAIVSLLADDADAPLRYDLFVAPTNTGVPSGHDLNNDGAVVTEPGTRGYAEDCFGYGEFPGQYAMALLVRRDAGSIDRDRARTFRNFLWKDMPGALLPPREIGPDGAEVGAWYTDDALRVLRLSSKSHWDVPVLLACGATLHVLASHPTPPVFDGPEDRNGRRNHDEIRFWVDYVSGAGASSYIVDDAGHRGGLRGSAHFVVLGDLNADPEKGDGRREAIRALLAHPRVNGVEPVAHGERATIASRPDGSPLRRPIGPSDTALFGLRADFALPSASLTTLRSGIIREESPEISGLAARDAASRADAPWWLPLFPSDHYPVYVDVLIPSETTRTDR